MFICCLGKSFDAMCLSNLMCLVYFFLPSSDFWLSAIHFLSSSRQWTGPIPRGRPTLTFIYAGAVLLKGLPGPESPAGLVKSHSSGPHPWVSDLVGLGGTWERTFLAISQVMWMLLVTHTGLRKILWRGVKLIYKDFLHMEPYWAVRGIWPQFLILQVRNHDAGEHMWVDPGSTSRLPESQTGSSFFLPGDISLRSGQRGY